MAFSMFSSSMFSNNILLSKPALSNTILLPAQTSIRCANISSDGSSIVFVNTSKNVFVSTNYGVSFTQAADLPTIPEEICISNGGNNIVALQESNAIGWPIAVPQNYGNNWTITSLATQPWGNNHICVSANGKYICICGGGVDGIWINNNYGDSTYWVNLNRVFDAYVSVTQARYPLEVMHASISSSGQYIVATINCPWPSYILYSSDFGISFSLIKSNIDTYGGPLRISSTGDFTVFGGLGGPTYSSHNITSPTSKTFETASSAVLTLMNSSTIPNTMFSNESGSLFYFIKETGYQLYKIYLSTDNLQSATIYNNLISSTSGRIWASSNTKYMLFWGVNSSEPWKACLRLITNNLL
jgi:hypothetical protein